jgi:isoquinoline 1-oxidoreductase alpha subunit
MLREESRMDTSAEGFADSEVPVVDQAPHSGDTLTEDAALTRRRALKGGAGAILAAATVIVAGGAGATEAVAATTALNTSSNDVGGSSAKGQKLVLNVNGKNRTVNVSPGTMLLYVLRDELHLRGPKFGCGLAECGACSVLLDGKEIRSCITPVSFVVKNKSAVVTLDGLAENWRTTKKIKNKTTLHPVQQAWIDEQVPQCGYCQSGQMIKASELLSKNPKPTKAEIKSAMNGHLCRCGTYNSIMRAIQRASMEMS